MKTLVQLAVIGAILYLGLMYAKPWLEELLGERGLGPLGGGGSEALACIASIERTNESFTDAVLEHGNPPVDIARWSGPYKLTEGRLRKAAIACDCQAAGCEAANDALRALERAMTSTDLAIRSRQPSFDLARDQEVIGELLKRARNEAG